MVTVHESVGVARLLKFIAGATVTPGLVPPVLLDNMTLVDGSSIMTLDIPAAIDSCRQLVDTDEDIILDVIMAQQGTPDVRFA